MRERFQPVSNTPPTNFAGKIKFFGRMVLDLQNLTVYRDLKDNLPAIEGDLLDVGCGQSPYKFLLDQSKTSYRGIDILEAENFNYHNTEITRFNGEDIPFESESFDGLICTEVLEHVSNYQKLIDEMHRVLKIGGQAILTVPWSARYHYIPFDFFRYTPSSLEKMFSKFAEVKIKNRGTDISNIANKVIVLWFRNLLPDTILGWLFVPFWILLSPILLITILIAHLSLWFDLGAAEDPLGYTILVKK